MEVLGIDIGGSGIKGAPVETETGEMLAPRYRIPTPQPSKPKPVAEVVAEIARHFKWQGPIGAGFPAVVQDGITMSAANVHKKWIKRDAAALITEVTGCETCVINDADAAGLAEMAFGAGRDRKGTVLIATLGTGIGTAIFSDGYLLPNTEFGHLEVRGMDAEVWTSDAARKRENLSWKDWASRLNVYLGTMERLISPDFIILGGGVSKKHEKFITLLNLQAEVVPAQLLNEAGIVGAALGACAFQQGKMPGVQ
jgi:polyphosphate glucokinase